MDEQVKKHNRKFALLWGLFMGVVTSIIAGIGMGVAVFLIEVLYLLVISPVLERRNKNRVKKLYREISQKMPGATARQREEAVRQTAMKRQTIKAAVMFFGGAAAYLSVGIFLAEAAEGAWKPVLLLICLAGIVTQICSVFVFVHTLHDPLTPKEQKELEVRDRIEKTRS